MAIIGVKTVELLWSFFYSGQGEDWLSAWPSMMEDNLSMNLSDPGLSNQSILYYSNLLYIFKAKFPTSIYWLSSNLENIIGSLISDQSSLTDSTNSLLRCFEKLVL